MFPVVSIEMDYEAGAVYLRISRNKVRRTVEAAPEVFLDLDYRNAPVGLELINPEAVLLDTIRKVEREFHLPQVSRFVGEPLLKTAMNM